MKQPKQSPERALRLQAGVKPLQKRMATLAPKGRQNVLPPLRGLGVHCPDYRGFTPACSLFRPSALGWETSIIIIRRLGYAAWLVQEFFDLCGWQ